MFCWLLIRPARDLRIWVLMGLAAAYFVIAAFASQNTSRFYFEPLIWMLLAVVLSQAGKTLTTIFRFAVAGQAIAILGMLVFGITILTPGGVSAKSRERIMNRHANGYHVMRWSDSILPPNATVLALHRSMGLVPRAAQAADWITYVNRQDREITPYLSEISAKRVTHVLYFGERSSAPFHDCYGRDLAGIETYLANRNPFNENIKVDAHIAVFEHDRLPGCAWGQP
jgi:hypothetical protein